MQVHFFGPYSNLWVTLAGWGGRVCARDAAERHAPIRKEIVTGSTVHILSDASSGRPRSPGVAAASASLWPAWSCPSATRVGKGTVFLLLEDEHGQVQVVVSRERDEANHEVGWRSTLLVVYGIVERNATLISVVGRRFQSLGPADIDETRHQSMTRWCGIAVAIFTDGHERIGPAGIRWTGTVLVPHDGLRIVEHDAERHASRLSGSHQRFRITALCRFS